MSCEVDRFMTALPGRECGVCDRSATGQSVLDHIPEQRTLVAHIHQLRPRVPRPYLILGPSISLLAGPTARHHQHHTTQRRHQDSNSKTAPQPVLRRLLRKKTLKPPRPLSFLTAIRVAMAFAHAQGGARLLLTHAKTVMRGGYAPVGNVKREAYIKPGSLGCGMDRGPMNPSTATQ